MAFVNEYVSAEDAKKYDFARLFKRFDKSLLGHPTWTIDRENDAFLLWLRASREESRNYQMFAMWWKGKVFPVYLIPTSGGRLNEKSFTHWRLMELELPEELNLQRSEIVNALKAALIEFKEFGIRVPVVDHTVTFEF